MTSLQPRLSCQRRVVGGLCAEWGWCQGLDVKLIIDDNDVTITGHPSEYLKGYDLAKTMEGHGLMVPSSCPLMVPSSHPLMVPSSHPLMVCCPPP